MAPRVPDSCSARAKVTEPCVVGLLPPQPQAPQPGAPGSYSLGSLLEPPALASQSQPAMACILAGSVARRSAGSCVIKPSISLCLEGCWGWGQIDLYA